jgi:(E)-4-hydroxy-3-methylbut-2-enyl-diphosphate synthase
MAAKEAGVPIRIGINSGSLEKDLLEKYGRPTPEALAESAMRNVRMFENEFGFGNLVLSIKSKDVRENFLAHKAFREMWRGGAAPPIHIGITEAGVGEAALIKSAVGIGSLLLCGLGDTIRVSLTGDPIREIAAAKNLLAALGLRKGAINIISCPTCGRCEVNLEEIALRLKSDLREIEKAREASGRRSLDVAVMGCPVNGPGEAKDADIGIAFSSTKSILFTGGEKDNAIFENACEAIKKVVEFCERSD